CRDGLQLLRRLLDDCWDRLNPVIEDGDLEVRAAPLNWLDDPDRGARFPSTLRSVPLVSANGQSFSWQYWRYAHENRPQAQIAEFDKAADATPREQCQAVMDDLDACVAELDQLTELLTAKLEEAAPALSEVRQALQDCRTLTGQILQRKGPPPEPEPGPGEEAPAGEGEAGGGGGAGGEAGDRRAGAGAGARGPAAGRAAGHPRGRLRAAPRGRQTPPADRAAQPRALPHPQGGGVRRPVVPAADAGADPRRRRDHRDEPRAGHQGGAARRDAPGG